MWLQDQVGQVLDAHDLHAPGLAARVLLNMPDHFIANVCYKYRFHSILILVINMDPNTLLLNLQIISIVVQTLSLLALILYVIKTWEMASAARRSAIATEMSVAEMKEARDQETAPYVVAYFEIPMESHAIYLVVKNIGRSVAKSVKIEFTPSLKTTHDYPLSEISIFTDGIESMPPGFEIRTLVDGIRNYFGDTSLPLKYNVKISYVGGIANTERIQEQILDLSALKVLLLTYRKDIGHLVDEIGRLRKELERIREVNRDIFNSINEGIFINNPILPVAISKTDAESWIYIVQAKLFEFKTIWRTIEQEERFEGKDFERLRRQAMYISDQLLLLLANRPGNVNSDFIDSISSLCTSLNNLGKVTIYIFDNDSVNNFFAEGNQIIKQIEEVLPFIDHLSQASKKSHTE